MLFPLWRLNIVWITYITIVHSFVFHHWSSLTRSSGYYNSNIFNNTPIKQSIPDETIDIRIPANSNSLQQLVIKFNCDDIDSDIISEFLFETGSLSVSCEVESEKKSYLEEKIWSDIQKTKNWQTAILRANFPSSFYLDGLIDLIKTSYGDITTFDFEVSFVEDKDWVSHVQSSWEPMVINDLTLSFPWHNLTTTSMTYSGNTQRHIILEGGAAFGTGDHSTTRLCIKWLQRYCANNQTDSNSSDNISYKIGGSILDYGCGSAVLGLVGLSYGMTEAVGVDIDIDSLISAQRNCEFNHYYMELILADESEVDSDEEKSIILNQFRGKNEDYDVPNFSTISKLPKKYFNVVVANILAPILIQIAPQLAEYTSNEQGKIVLSGVLKTQADRVISVYSEYFDDMVVDEEENDWVVISGTKKSLK